MWSDSWYIDKRMLKKKKRNIDEFREDMEVVVVIYYEITVSLPVAHLLLFSFPHFPTLTPSFASSWKQTEETNECRWSCTSTGLIINQLIQHSIFNISFEFFSFFNVKKSYQNILKKVCDKAICSILPWICPEHITTSLWLCNNPSDWSLISWQADHSGSWKFCCPAAMFWWHPTDSVGRQVCIECIHHHSKSAGASSWRWHCQWSFPA